MPGIGERGVGHRNAGAGIGVDATIGPARGGLAGGQRRITTQHRRTGNGDGSGGVDRQAEGQGRRSARRRAVKINLRRIGILPVTVEVELQRVARPDHPIQVGEAGDIDVNGIRRHRVEPGAARALHGKVCGAIGDGGGGDQRGVGGVDQVDHPATGCLQDDVAVQHRRIGNIRRHQDAAFQGLEGKAGPINREFRCGDQQIRGGKPLTTAMQQLPQAAAELIQLRKSALQP